MTTPALDRQTWQDRVLKLPFDRGGSIGLVPSDPSRLPPVTLTPEQTSCPACGIPVPWTEETCARSERIQVQPTTGNPTRGWRSFVRCTDCQNRADLAVTLAPLVDHDAVNGRPVKADTIIAAIDGMALAGLNLPADATRDNVLAIVRLFSLVGGSARWASHVDADSIDRAHATPWAHVHRQLRRQADEAAVHLAAERLAATWPPHPIPASAVTLTEEPGTIMRAGACLVCGVGTVMLSAVRVLRLERIGNGLSVRQCWTMRTARLASLGITPTSPANSHVRGVTCPDCSHAIDAEGGALGWSAITRALLVHLDLWHRAAHLIDEDLDIPTWASLHTSTPNPQPWAHLDQTELRATLAPLVPGPLGRLDEATTGSTATDTSIRTEA